MVAKARKIAASVTAFSDTAHALRSQPRGYIAKSNRDLSHVAMDEEGEDQFAGEEMQDWDEEGDEQEELECFLATASSQRPRGTFHCPMRR